jgi:1-acyl-sn-glycerol-3-phosphate acyltransferase
MPGERRWPARVRVRLRAAAIIQSFALAVPLHWLARMVGRGDAIPPRFLVVVGWLCGLRVRVAGAPADGPLLLVANHLSWLDILALAGTARSAFVAHAGLASHGFLKWLCDQNDTEFVTRDRRGSVTGQVAQVRAALARRRLTIFPEGTTSDGLGLLPFKSSLLSSAEQAPEVTVQPVALAYAEAPAVAWPDGEPGLANVHRILQRRRPVHLTIHFLPPLTGEDRRDRKAMAAAAQAAIAAALDLADGPGA